MKLEKILDNLNSFEKNSFLKIIDNIYSNNPKNKIAIDKILSDNSKDLKTIDSINISKVFSLVEEEYYTHLSSEFVEITSQLDIVTDILTKDGHCIAKIDWFARLYENELTQLNIKLKEFNRSLNDLNSDVEPSRRRDYDIYKACIIEAYQNDQNNNQENKITQDEQSILITLAKKLDLSQEEVKLINYSVLPVNKKDIETLINVLKNIGVIFFSKKLNLVFIPQEIISVLRKIRKKEIADKFFRRVLRQIREPQINLVCKKHNIDRKFPLEQKIEIIISQGISFSGVLMYDIFKDDTLLPERKKYFNELTEKCLNISPPIKGTTLEEKTSNLIKYLNDLENDERLSIPLDGYQKLLKDLKEFVPNVNSQIKKMFELQDENILDGNIYN